MAVPVTAALAAAQAGSIGIGFSGGGFLLPFFLGVIDMLYNELQIMRPSDPVAGGSAGALAAVAANGLFPPETMRREVEHLSNFCRGRGNCWGVVKDEISKICRRNLGPDAGAYLNRHGRTFVAVTLPDPAGKAPATHRLVSRFKDTDDLISTGEASIYVPFWAGAALSVKFRGEDAYDGSFAGPGRGFLPCPPNVTYCVRVCPFPAGTSIARLLTLDLLQGGPPAKASLAGGVASTLLGADAPGNIAATLRSFLGGSKRDLGVQAAQTAQLLAALSAVVTPGEGDADIWPGRRHKLPVDRATWTMWTAVWTDRAGILAMYELGRAEALSWAREAGFAAAKRYSLETHNGKMRFRP
ncbi:MAG: hypothetical protein J3K34DRAFT_4301 [Monoraphidium minutum]|nr:MAG: hypothetical protein J3K34DRAFT_4301 [Monoraphidium minutum]